MLLNVTDQLAGVITQSGTSTTIVVAVFSSSDSGSGSSIS